MDITHRSAVPAGFADPDGPTSADLVSCVRCGLCLSACPTYQELGLETDSPRGRIHLMRAVGDGRLTFTDSVVDHLDKCLGCRACETVCPSGVPYGRMLEHTRGVIGRQTPPDGWRGIVQRFAFRTLLPSQPMLRLAAGGLRFFQQSGLQGLVRKSGLIQKLPTALSAIEPLTPTVPNTMYDAPPSGFYAAKGERRGQVAFFVGCVMPVVFGPVENDTIEVLVANGFDVVVPQAQSCCGALQAHGGDRDIARELARSNIAAFENIKVDAIILNSAGCGSTMKEYDELFHGDAEWSTRAAAVSHKVKDISEFLMSVGLRGAMGEVALTVTYQDACHLVHGQRIRNQPRQLLRSIPGLKLVELKDADRCCGSAGIYNLVHPEIAQPLLARKVADIEATGATVVAAGNPGCLMQIASGLETRDLPVHAVHTVTLLAEAYRRARP